MKASWIPISIRFVLLIVLQVTIFKRIGIDYSIFSFAHIFIYPLWVIFFPVKYPKAVLMILAFCMGLCIDIFYDSPGVHAASLVFLAFSRGFILNLLEPDKGYDLDNPFNLRRLGFIWVLSYLGLSMLLYLFFYFSVEAFSIVYIYEIVISTILSLICSIVIMFIYTLIDNPSIR